MRDVGILMSGTVIAQGLSLAAAPVLTRLFAPALFGALGALSSIASIFAALSSLRYETAIPLPKRDEDAANLLALSVLITFGIAALTVCLVAAGGRWLERLVQIPNFSTLLSWLPPFIAAAGLYEALNHWCTRRGDFLRLSLSRVTQSGVSVGSQIGLGAISPAASGLVGGWVAGQATGTFALAYQVWRRDFRLIHSALSWKRLRAVAAEYREFPAYSAPQNVLNALSQGLPPLVLAHFFNPAAVGFYVLAQRLLQVPITLAGNSVRQVLLPKLADTINKVDDARTLFIRATAGLAGAGIVPTAAVVIWGPALFRLVLGEAWTPAGEFGRWLAVWLFFGLANIPSVVLGQVLRKQKQLFGYDLALLVARTAALLLGGLSGSVEMAIVLFAIAGATFNAGLIIWMHLVIRQQPREQPICT